MAALFVGQAYSLRERKAAWQRCVNLYLSGIETPDKAPFILEGVPGLRTFATLTGECRGMIENADGRTFAVYGSNLVELFADGTTATRGSLLTSTGEVSMAYGLFQLVMVDGPNGYVLTLSGNTFQQIVSEGFYGSDTVEFLSNFFSFIRPDTQQQYIAAVNDATQFDPLDFRSAEQSPDNLVSQIALNSVLWMFGVKTTEFFYVTGDGEYPFTTNGQGVLEIGCVAVHSAKKVGDSVIWIGRTEEGFGIVYRSLGYGAQRISTQAVEQALQEADDLSQAVAYTEQRDGLTFWCVNAPGLKATWCYEMLTGAWHERCEVDNLGEYAAGRITHHVYAMGKHLGGAANGNVYEMRTDLYTNDGDVLRRERVSPHAAVPSLSTLFFSRFVLDCSTGGRGQRAAGTGLNDALDNRFDDLKVELSWADWRPNRALQFGNAILRSVGYIGQTFARVVWNANVLGCAKDRVWRVRFSGNAPFSLIGAEVDAMRGTD